MLKKKENTNDHEFSLISPPSLRSHPPKRGDSAVSDVECCTEKAQSADRNGQTLEKNQVEPREKMGKPVWGIR